MKLPKEWLIANIERYADPILNAKHEDIYIEYGNLFPLYFDIDLDLTKRLIERAIAHPNPDVQEHGREWLEDIKNDKGISGDKNE